MHGMHVLEKKMLENGRQPFETENFQVATDAQDAKDSSPCKEIVASANSLTEDNPLANIPSIFNERRYRYAEDAEDARDAADSSSRRRLGR